MAATKKLKPTNKNQSEDKYFSVKNFRRRALSKAENYWNNLGPGLTTGAADDDPSGIATYSQAGAKYGFQFLWLAPLTFPIMAVIQEMCARIGIVTGRGLAANIRAHFPKWVLYLTTGLLFFANTFNLGADLGAMAQAVKLLWPNGNFTVLVIFFSCLSLLLQFFVSYKNYARYLKWMAFTLMAYIFTGLLLDIDARQLAYHSLVPHLGFDRGQILLVCAILGTTISPYLFFWQTSQEVEEEILSGKTTLKLRQAETQPEEITEMRKDVWTGMFFSNLVMFFIIMTCAATLYPNGIHNISNASEAAEALRPLAGNRAFLLFTLGIIGTGLLAVPILAGGAAYALSEAFGLRNGLYRKPKKAVAFYTIIGISMILGLLINFSGLDSMRALIYSAVLNGLIAPIILILIVKISGSAKIMKQWKNGKFANFFGWLTVLLMLVIAIATILSLLF